MKNLITKFLGIGGLSLLILSSCKKDGALVNATNGSPGSLTASSTTLVLNSANSTSSTAVITFNLTQANFGYNAAITNTLQLDAAGDNWANPYTVVMNPDVFTQSFNTSDFNNLMLKLGLKGGTASQVNVRVLSAIGKNTSVYTNVVTLTVTPYNLKSWLYITGAFSGWVNPGAAEDSLYSATSNGIYVGIINFTAGNNQFLILPAKNWSNKYATSGSSVPSTTVTYNASNNLYAPSTPGQYIVTFNQTAGTISFALADYYSVIGDAAQGWGTDVPMKYINDGSGNWTVTLPLVSTGSFKVRQDNAWSNSWGIPNSGSAGYGVANTLNNSSNSNIPVAASGNYVVTFNAPATTFGSPALATTTYTSVKQ